MVEDERKLHMFTKEVKMKNLRTLRKASGLTQIALCEKLNIAQATLWGYETGAHEPDMETILKIADYFSVSVDYLLGREELGGVTVRPSESSLPEDERQLLALFRSMTHPQQVRFVAYGEGIVGAQAPVIKA